MSSSTPSPPIRRPWAIIDEAARHPAEQRSPAEQGKILAEVIALAEAISQGKNVPRVREPLLMPPFPTHRR